MTAKSFYESRHGLNKKTMSDQEVWKEMEEFSNHRWEGFKKAKEVFNVERWVAQSSYEETVRILKDNK